MQEKINDLIGWLAAGALAAIPLTNWAGIPVTAEMVASLVENVNGWLLMGAGTVAAVKVWAAQIKAKL